MSVTKVKVDGVEYSSVAKAFAALNLPMSKHQKFRKLLKEKGKMKFDKHLFEIV